MDKLLTGSGGTLNLVTYDSAGVVADVNSTNAPTIAVKDSAGTSVLAPTGVRDGNGTYHTDIPVTLVILDTYTVTWTWPNSATRTTAFEVVGSFLYSVSEFRAFDPALANATTYPTSVVRDVRETVEERLERAANVSFTRRGYRDILDGDSTCSLMVRRSRPIRVTSLKINSATVDLAGVRIYPTGKLELTSGTFAWGRQNVEVLYEAGYDPVPLPVHDAGIRYGRSLIVKGVFDDMSRATSIQTDVGLMRISQAGQGKTGIPDVDAVIADFGYAGALVG